MADFSDERIQGIIQGRRVIGRFPFPGSEGSHMVGVRLLTESEIDIARFNAQFYIKSRCERVGLSLVDFVNIDPESLDREHQRQVLFAAILSLEGDPDNPPRFFKDDAQVRALDSVLVDQLWREYADWQEASNPMLSLKKEEVDELVEALKKEPTARVLLAHFESGTLRSLVRTLASQLQTSPNGSSPISP